MKTCVICGKKNPEMYDLFCGRCYDEYGEQIEDAAATLAYADRAAWEEAMRRWWENEVMPENDHETT
ncbi:MAG: hypothetical protein JXQ72_16550 [Anaerolineae bacterium]|nr:hypothetical protein [Anaerolineae bacterium]